MKDSQHLLNLRTRIAALEIQQAESKMELTHFVKQTIEKLSPSNLLQSVFEGNKQDNPIPDDVANGFIGIATGFVSKLLFQGTSHSPVRRLIGTALMLGVSGIVSRNPEKIKGIVKGGFNLLSNLYKKK